MSMFCPILKNAKYNLQICTFVKRALVKDVPYQTFPRDPGKLSMSTLKRTTEIYSIQNYAVFLPSSA